MVLNDNNPIVLRFGENARGFELDLANANLTGCTVTAVLENFTSGVPVPNYTGSIMNATLLQASGPAKIQWSLPNPFTPVLPVGLYRLYFKVTFADGRVDGTNYLQIQVTAA